MDERFIREGMLLGEAALEKLKASHVAVVGLGGVGSWCAEALARSGVGELTLLDSDCVSRSNRNRQSIAREETDGRPKAEASAEMLRAIVPEIRLHPLCTLYNADYRERFFSVPYDYVVDAIDLVSCKLDLILSARERGIPVISALGTGNKLDATQLRIADIAQTQGCPLARVVRKELRRRGVEHHTVVYSPEQAREALQVEAPPPGRRSVPGSVIWVPACAGMLLASRVVLDLAGAEEQNR